MNRNEGKYLAGDSELRSCKCCWKQVYLWKKHFPLLYSTSFPCNAVSLKIVAFSVFRYQRNGPKTSINGRRRGHFCIFTMCLRSVEAGSTSSLIEKLYSIATNHLSWMFLAFSLALAKSTETIQEQKPFKHLNMTQISASCFLKQLQWQFFRVNVHP